jgi:hypothetical protein
MFPASSPIGTRNWASQGSRGGLREPISDIACHQLTFSLVRAKCSDAAFKPLAQASAGQRPRWSDTQIKLGRTRKRAGSSPANLPIDGNASTAEYELLLGVNSE